MKAMLILLTTLVVSTASAQDQKADAERALKAIEAYTALQAKTDPHYHAVEGALVKEIDEMLRTNPAREWLTVIRRRYVALSEAEHAKETAMIRASEARAAGALAAGDQGWQARSAQLEHQLTVGTLGPRLHAIHMREAAQFYHPGNGLFLQWRSAKVPIATDYEMGTITRSEYEDRWQKITASFMDRQAADDRARHAIQAQAAAEEYRAALQHSQRPVLQPQLRCRTTTSFGVTTTRCN